jgi:hypothetical protein
MGVAGKLNNHPRYDLLNACEEADHDANNLLRVPSDNERTLKMTAHDPSGWTLAPGVADS